ncbi:MAG TPA: ribonuclease E activity regulator RraA [Terriglobia bacterium]|nr:ribonuclease E activity regulator RraA [Terriglobia bacterium]
MKAQFSTSDLYDAFIKRCSSCETQFKQYGGRREFCGRIRTVKCLDDNVLLRQVLETPSDGEVLVVDGGAHLGSALLGDMIAAIGAKSGWSGVIIFGAIRDVGALAKMDFGVKALGSNPQKSAKNGAGCIDEAVAFGGVVFTPGHWLYSDDDGIIVSSDKLV